MEGNIYSHPHFIKNHLGGFIGVIANIVDNPKKISISKTKKISKKTNCSFSESLFLGKSWIWV